jgi:hypothetical protein
LLTLVLSAAAYATTYDAQFASSNQVAHLEGHLLPALLVFVLWIAQGASSGIDAASRLLGNARLANALMALVLVAAFAIHLWRAEIPTSAARTQSQSIHSYWSEVLAYPLEEDSALTGHWGDLTAFWYFQYGEGMRPDLWAIFPPNIPQIEAWLAESGRPVYLAGPLLDWSPELSERYSLTPWGILVRISSRDHLPSMPPMEARSALLGNGLILDGYQTLSPRPGRWQLWLAWRTAASTSRDLSVSVRLHAPDGTLLQQEDGRLASLWFPDAVLPAEQSLLSVFDLEPLEDPLPGTVVRIVVYDPQTAEPLLSSEGRDVIELGPLTRD